MANAKLDAEKINQIYALHKRGYHNARIAKELSVSANVVTKYIKLARAMALKADV